TVTRINNCSDYIINEVVSLGAHRNACKTFKANKTIKYTDPNKSLNGLREIGFYFNIPNISAEEATNIGIASLSIQLTSPDFNPLLNPDQVISNMDKAVLSNLILLWDFIAGMANYAAVVKFRTIAYKAILPNDANAIIGLAPKHHVTYYLESDAHYFPFNSNTTRLPNGTTSYFSVAAGSFIQEQTIEQRTHTVFSALAAGGGFSGILLGVYAFLFGKSIKPYGYVHSLFNSVPKFYTNSGYDIDSRVTLIEQYLQNFMHIKRDDEDKEV
ncbi:5920_t:CDS:2, partial [Dentiscutata heterogama]